MEAKKPFYTGEAKVQRLAELAEEANVAHCQARTAWRGALEYGYQCGVALLEARRIQGGRRKWGKWVEDHFNGSRRTAREYMRIARNWNEPHVIAARTSDLGVTSLRSMLQVISGNPPRKPPDRSTRDGWREILLIHLRKKFNNEFAYLTEEEISACDDAFSKDIWPVTRAALAHAVWAASGDEEHLEKQPGQHAANRRVKFREALTEKLTRLSTPEIELLVNNFNEQIWSDWYQTLKRAMSLVHEGWYDDDEPGHRGIRVRRGED